MDLYGEPSDQILLLGSSIGVFLEIYETLLVYYIFT